MAGDGLTTGEGLTAGDGLFSDVLSCDAAVAVDIASNSILLPRLPGNSNTGVSN